MAEALANRAVAALLSATLAGCTPAGPASAGPPGQVTLAPGLAFTLPPPAALGRTIEAEQLITGQHGGESFAFQTRISATQARLLVAGFDTLGRRALTIAWTGTALTVEAAPWVPAELRPGNVVADIVLLHWPADAIRAGLSAGATLREDGAVRVVALAGRELVRIERMEGAGESWSGHWHDRNAGWHYALDIRSVEAAP